MDIVELNDGAVSAEKEFIEPLVALRLDTLRGVFAYSGEGYLRTHANRDNFHIVSEDGAPHIDFFLKRHRGFEIREALKLLMSRAPFKTAGRREWDNLQRLRALGIKIPRPVAVGEKRFLGFERLSFIITERIPGGAPLDEHIRERWSGELDAGALLEKRALLWDLGEAVRRIHNAGLTHMDLYLSHFFVSETSEGDKELYLIDLQRMAKRWLFQRRWIVKDLAALLYSGRDLPLTRTDFARFFTAYFDGRASRAGRRLVSAAIGRAARMARRARKHNTSRTDAEHAKKNIGTTD